jgi:hypothetical protein
MKMPVYKEDVIRQKALVYHGPEKRSWEEKPKPKIKN